MTAGMRHVFRWVFDAPYRQRCQDAAFAACLSRVQMSALDAYDRGQSRYPLGVPRD